MHNRAHSFSIVLMRVLLVAVPFLFAFASPARGAEDEKQGIEFVNVGDSDVFLAVKTGTKDCTQEGDEKQMMLEPDQSYSVDADFACYGYGTDKQHTTDWKKAQSRGVIELSVDD